MDKILRKEILNRVSYVCQLFFSLFALVYSAVRRQTILIPPPIPFSVFFRQVNLSTTLPSTVFIY